VEPYQDITDLTVARPRITDQAWCPIPSVVKQATIASAINQIGVLMLFFHSPSGDGPAKPSGKRRTRPQARAAGVTR
jgi:hypothetical protein